MTETQPNAPVLIDVRGLKCPLPVLKAAKRMAPHPAGTRFTVLTTDPMAMIDIPHFCAEQRHRILSHGEEAGVFRFQIQKG